MDASPRIPPVARTALWALAVLMLAFTAELALPILPPAASELFEKFASNILFIGSALVCAWRAIAIPRERTAWLLFAAGLLAWGLGDLYYTLALWNLDEVPIPSLADAGYLALYPPVYAGLALLFRSRVKGHGGGFWIDGLIAALAIGALAATLLFDAVLAGTGGSPASVATNLAYPLADLLIVALVGGVLALTGWRVNSAWAWIAGGIAIFAVTDSVYLYQSAVGTYAEGGVLDAGWPLAAVMIAYAGWLPVSDARVASSDRWPAITLPLLLAVSCLGMLVYDHFEPVNLLAVGLAGAAMLAVLARLAMTFKDNVRMLATSRHEATTDALTGLHNRRAMTIDLERVLADGADGRSYVLALFDLDGFKLYNDTFGHPAGDALLARLGHTLAEAVAPEGRAYRMGGDEFCMLRPVQDGAVDATVANAAFALTERGEGFSVGCSYGSILLPQEAPDAQTALRIVDQRMFQQKQSGRTSAGRQSRDVLFQALVERHPELGRHMSDVAALADAVARRLGLPDMAVAEVRLAAELHDVGKVAIPDAILDKPEQLDDEEWAFMRRHTLVGERIVAAAPALANVSKVVRSSHERVDGRGYPDGLAGNDIPLGARIVFVCDSFNAMVTQRPYAAPVSEQDALAELRRCAGSQFDPVVVEALCGLITDGRGAPEPVSAPGGPSGP